MTNKEIDEETQLLCDLLVWCNAEQEGETIGVFFRRLVSQAYQEAAQIARSRGEEMHEAALDCGHASSMMEVAGEIQKLADSLVVETVSSQTSQ